MRPTHRKPEQSQQVGRTNSESDSRRHRRDRGAVLTLGAAVFVTLSGPAHATIDNSATASGNYAEEVVQSDAAVLNLDVEPARAELAVSQTAVLDVSGGDDPDNADAGDRVVLTVTVTNAGNIPAEGVRPAGAAVLIDGEPGSGTLGAFEPAADAPLPPGESREFTAAYTLSAEDIYRTAGGNAALAARVSAEGTGPSGPLTAQAEPAAVDVPANPRLEIRKEAAIAKADGNTGADIEAGDTITYTYTVLNTGNVPITDIGIADEHEGTLLNSADVAGATEGPHDETILTADPLGTSSDESGPNGVWDVLGAGGAVTFTYVHTVTQAEFEAQ